jgi:aryl-phospho-beta-D-glucosidase BglC (GH1 family)
MQIHEITESFLRNVGRGFVQGVTGTYWDKTPQVSPGTAPRISQGTSPGTQNTVERITVTIAQRGQAMPSKYYKIQGKWTNELGQEIRDVKQKAYLEKLVPAHGKKDFIKTEPAGSQAQSTRRRRRTKP